MSRPLTTEELKLFSKVFSDCWNLIKKYGMPTDRSDEYWQPLIDEAKGISREAGEHVVAVKLVCGLLDGLERHLVKNEGGK